MTSTRVRFSSTGRVAGWLWTLAILLTLGSLRAEKPDEKPAEAAKTDFAPIRELIRRRLLAENLPSLTVAVARDGQFLWEEGFGWADREKRLEASPHVVYSLASISKPITATGLMVLVEQGHIKLDQPINDYLGDAKLKAWLGDAKDATVRRVLNHTSGLGLHYQFFYEDQPFRRPAMDETIRRYGQLIRPPGERFSYSNLGYGILDHVLSKVSGTAYADFLRNRVFLPLGMTRASVDIGPGLEPFAAARYGLAGARLPLYDFDHPGGSAVYCSAHDLAKFGLFHVRTRQADQKAILSDESLEEMVRPGVLSAGTSDYGLGWQVRDRKGLRIIQHTGGMGGVSTILTLVPAKKVVIVVLANGNTDLPRVVQERLLGQLLPQQADTADRSPPDRAAKPPVSTLAGLRGTWRGSVRTYKGELPFTLTFQESGDVHARLGDQLKTLLNDVRFTDNELTGRMMSDLGTEDVNRRPYDLHLELTLRQERLTGAMVAMSRPGKRPGNALTHWVELRRQP